MVGARYRYFYELAIPPGADFFIVRRWISLASRCEVLDGMTTVWGPVAIIYGRTYTLLSVSDLVGEWTRFNVPLYT